MDDVDKDVLLDLTNLQNGADSLRTAIDVYHRTGKSHPEDIALRKVIRAGVIQNFETIYELSWKMMKRWLEKNVRADIVSGKPQIELYRRAAEYGLIEDIDGWMDFHRARNRTSHVNGEALAEEVLQQAMSFQPFVESLLRRLEDSNE
ncbi:MAG: nucleotidyltransferase substrate binding protein [Acidobacteriota bacterium]|nr:nucleotidyltransferase substrate binding protein [Acidobacteriota bacterium]